MSKRTTTIVALAMVVCLVALGTAGCGPRPVATVNGEKISQADFDKQVASVQEQYVAYGMEMTEETLASIRSDVLDQMIDELLLLQAAKGAGIAVTKQEVDDYYAEMAAGYESEEAFLEDAAANGFTQASLREAITKYLQVNAYQEQYIADNVDPGSIAVTEAELRELYATYSAEIEEMPPYEEVVELLEQELRDQKLSDLGVFETMLEELRAAAEIVRNI